jgi:hypothetical protein
MRLLVAQRPKPAAATPAEHIVMRATSVRTFVAEKVNCRPHEFVTLSTCILRRTGYCTAAKASVREGVQRMNSVIDSDRYAGTRSPSSRTAGGSGGGFNVDDILRRLGVLETSLDDVRTQAFDIRVQLSAILGVLPSLATKADLTAEIGTVRKDLSAEVGGVRAEIGVVRKDLSAEIAGVRAEIGAARKDLSAEIAGGRAEIGAVRKELSAEIAGGRVEVGSVRTDLAASIGSVRADLHALETRLIKWIVGAALTSAGIAATIASLIVKFVH